MRTLDALTDANAAPLADHALTRAAVGKTLILLGVLFCALPLLVCILHLLDVLPKKALAFGLLAIPVGTGISAVGRMLQRR